VSATNLSAAVSRIDTQAMFAISGGRRGASATKEVTGHSTPGRRSGHTAVSIWHQRRAVSTRCCTASTSSPPPHHLRFCGEPLNHSITKIKVLLFAGYEEQLAQIPEKSKM